MDCLEHLALKGLSAPRPLESKSGSKVEAADTELGKYVSISYKALGGSIIGLSSMERAQIEEWGRLLGRLHNASDGLSHPRRKTWVDMMDSVDRFIETGDTVLAEASRRMRDTHEGLSPEDKSHGFVHFDFEPDNVVWDHTGPQAIDFDDCCYFCRSADIAFALREAFGDDPMKADINAYPASAFIQGYREERETSPSLENEVAMFLVFHNLYTAARLIRSLGTGPSEGEPEWCTGLRAYLGSKVDAYRGNVERAMAAGII